MSINNLPDGHVNMGPLDKLDMSALTEGMSNHRDPLDWDAFEYSPGKFKYRPVLTIEQVAQYEGTWRPTMHFYEGEREMYVMAFANATANFIFGRDMFLEKKKPFGTKFIPNPKFGKLQHIPIPKGTKEQREIEDTVDKHMASEDNTSIIPLVIVDDDNNAKEQIIASGITPPAGWKDNMPQSISLSRLNMTGDLLAYAEFQIVSNEVSHDDLPPTSDTPAA